MLWLRNSFLEANLSFKQQLNMNEGLERTFATSGKQVKMYLHIFWLKKKKEIVCNLSKGIIWEFRNYTSEMFVHF